jgi:hypothetical protein
MAKFGRLVAKFGLRRGEARGRRREAAGLTLLQRQGFLQPSTLQRGPEAAPHAGRGGPPSDRRAIAGIPLILAA